MPAGRHRDSASTSRSKQPVLAVLAIVLVASALWLILTVGTNRRTVPTSGDAGTEPAKTASSSFPEPAPPSRAVIPGSGKAEAPGPDPSHWEEELGRIRFAGGRIAELASQLSPGLDQPRDQELLEEIRRLLAELADALRALPNEVATEAILAYLQTGEDVLTRLRFQVGEGGLLAEAPSLRTFLLDLLPDIDATIALDFSLAVFDRSASPDEWALALRNIAWQDADGGHGDLLRDRLVTLLDQEEWLRQPTDGFLEAFDLAVHLGGESMLREMGSVLGLRDANGNLAANGVTHAAFLALDRMTAVNPAETIRLVEADRDFLSWAPGHRGALLSRADVRDPAQAAALQAHLTRPDLTREELVAFYTLFPNANGNLGDTLASNTSTPLDFSIALERDETALLLVRQWLADDRFAAHQPALVAVEAKLNHLVATAQASVPAATPATFAPSGPSVPPRR